jgi:predicted nucleic acid-binding protein
MRRAGRSSSTASSPRLHIAEPRAAYLYRPAIVVDASIVAAVLYDEGGRAEAEALLRGRALHAPHLIDYEIANVGLTKRRHEEARGEVVERAIQEYLRLPIERHTVDAAALSAIAALYDLTAYDAAYLCVAEKLMAPLATLDGKLAAAARKHLALKRGIHEP